MSARSVCLVTLSLSEAGPGRFGRQVSVTDIYHTIPYHTIPYLRQPVRKIGLRSSAATIKQQYKMATTYPSVPR